MEVRDQIIIATDFSDHLAARYRKDGRYSGEEFLEDILLPKFERAQNEGYILLIDLDGVYGYPSSFVSGSFGKLALDKGSDVVLKHIKFQSDENPLRIDEIVHEIKNPARLDV
jgi:hypothetical protein